MKTFFSANTKVPEALVYGTVTGILSFAYFEAAKRNAFGEKAPWIDSSAVAAGIIGSGMCVGYTVAPRWRFPVGAGVAFGLTELAIGNSIADVKFNSEKDQLRALYNNPPTPLEPHEKGEERVTCGNMKCKETCSPKKNS